MTDRLKIFRMLMPAEFVLFDHNPELLKVKREVTGGGAAKPSAGDSKSVGKAATTAGTLGAVFHGTDPMVITINRARLVGPECKVMVDTLLGWLSPVSGLVGAAVSAVLSTLGLDASKPPDLVVQWGPPTLGFVVTATLTKAEVSYLRITGDGVPVHALCDLTLKESPSPLSMTNPTSGGRPGRNRHVVHADESLMSIAMSAFGNPGAWRAIAEVNGVDDPRSVRPGDVLYLPAPDELHELSGRNR